MAKSATVGKLNVKLTANTAGFTRGMKNAARATKQTKVLMTGMKSAILALTNPFMAVAMALALIIKTARLVSDAITNAISRIDLLAKIGSKLGITTEELGKLQFAAELSGVKITTFNMAMQRLTRNIAEAAAGTGAAQKAFKELGLDARLLSKLPLEEAFKLIADAMSKVRNQGDRVRLTFKLVDSEGVALVNLFAVGSKGIEEMGQQFQNLGGIVSSVVSKDMEKLTDEATKSAVAWRGLGNSMAKMWTSLGGITSGISIAVAGGLKAVVDMVAFRYDEAFDPNRDLRQLAEQQAKQVKAMKAKRAAKRAAREARFGSGVPPSAIDTDALKKAGERAEVIISGLLTPMEQYEKKVAEIVQLQRVGAFSFDTMFEALGRLNKQWVDILFPIEEATEAIKNLNDLRLAPTLAAGGAAELQASFRAQGQQGGTPQLLGRLVRQGDRQTTADDRRNELLASMLRAAENVPLVQMSS